MWFPFLCSCEKCQKLRNGVKYSRLMSCPEILCIHLKRFRHEPALPSKISSHVSFPLTGLDLAPFMGKGKIFLLILVMIYLQ